MVSQEQGSHPESPDTLGIAEPAGAHPGKRPDRSRTWTLLLGVCLLAGLGAWVIGEAFLDYFKPSEAASAQRFSFAALNRETARTNGQNGAVAFGCFGALLGLGLGLAGGILRRSAGRAVIGGLVGLVLGAAAGALPSFVLMPWQWNHRNDDPSSASLIMSLLIHLGLWSGLGLTAGLAFGIGRSGLDPSRLVETGLAGLAGAMLGTFAFEMLGAVLFPLAGTAQPIADTPSARLLARLCVTVLVAVVVILALPATSRANPLEDEWIS